MCMFFGKPPLKKNPAYATACGSTVCVCVGVIIKRIVGENMHSGGWVLSLSFSFVSLYGIWFPPPSASSQPQFVRCVFLEDVMSTPFRCTNLSQSTLHV